MCTTSFHPPLEKYYFASVRGLASNRSERPCLAARTLLLADFAIGLPPQCRDLCQISWGFHPYDIAKFRRPLKRQRCIRVLATTIRGGVRLQFNSPGRLRRFSRPTKAILQGNQKGPCVRSLQTVGGELAYRSEIIFFWGGWKLVVHITVLAGRASAPYMLPSFNK